MSSKTNLDCFIQAFGWKGGTIHQVDFIFLPTLKVMEINSVSELDGLDLWLDFVMNARDIGNGHLLARQAYMIRFEGCLIR
jgi:hypothetical protein